METQETEKMTVLPVSLNRLVRHLLSGQLSSRRISLISLSNPVPGHFTSSSDGTLRLSSQRTFRARIILPARRLSFSQSSTNSEWLKERRQSCDKTIKLFFFSSIVVLQKKPPPVRKFFQSCSPKRPPTSMRRRTANASAAKTKRPRKTKRPGNA